MELDSCFQRVLIAMTKSAAEAADAYFTGKPVPSIKYGDSPSPRHDRSVADEFDLRGLEQRFSQGRTGGEHWGNLGSMHMQHSVLSQLRRDVQLRRRTRVEARAHAVARLQAAGADTGPLSGMCIEYAKGLMEVSGA